jgi:hypothetical protein
MDDIRDRIEKLKERAAALSEGRMVSGISPECPPDVEERFWEQVLELENAATVKPIEVFAQSGLVLPAPEDLEDAALTKHLWDAIHALAELGVYLLSTDHLSDRALYQRLWRGVLIDDVEVTDDGWSCIDMAGGGSEEDISVWLKYYATEDDRREWAEEWPNEPVPPAERRPFDRDRHLPQLFEP